MLQNYHFTFWATARYGYTGNSPIALFDPTGLYSISGQTKPTSVTNKGLRAISFTAEKVQMSAQAYFAAHFIDEKTQKSKWPQFDIKFASELEPGNVNISNYSMSIKDGQLRCTLDMEYANPGNHSTIRWAQGAEKNLAGPGTSFSVIPDTPLQGVPWYSSGRNFHDSPGQSWINGSDFTGYAFLMTRDGQTLTIHDNPIKWGFKIDEE